MGGFSEHDKLGKLFYDPEGREAFRRELKNGMKPEVKVVEVNAHINDEVFTGKVLELLECLADVSGHP